MRIKQIHIVTDGDLVNLQIESLSDSLNVIQTTLGNDRDVSAEFQASLSDILHGKGRLTGSQDRSTASVTFEIGNSSIVRHLDRNHAHTRRWSTLQNLVDEKSVEKTPPPNAIIDSKVINKKRNVPTLPRLWQTFLSNAESLICGTDAPLVTRLLESYTRLIESSESFSASEVQLTRDDDLAPQPSKSQATGNSISRGKCCLLRARISEIETEMAELSRHQTNLPALLARRTHLSKRLKQPAPPLKTLSSSRESELLKEKQTLTDEHTILVEQQQRTRQHIADIELDLQACRPQRRGLEANHSRLGIAEDYQQLCVIRDRAIHDLTRLDRQCLKAQTEIRKINRRLDQATAKLRQTDTPSSKYSVEHRSLQTEIRRINGQIQCIERINWLEERRLNLQEQIDAEERSEPLNDLLEKANFWYRKLSDQNEGTLHLQPSSTHRNNGRPEKSLTVCIDRQPEARLTIFERHVASLACRLAVAEQLSNKTSSAPIIVRIPELKNSLTQDLSVHRHVANTLAEYSRLHGQIIVLTGDSQVASIFSDAGAKSHLATSTVDTDINQHSIREKNPIKTTGEPPRTIQASAEDEPHHPAAAREVIEEQTPIASKNNVIELSTNLDQVKLLATTLSASLSKFGITTIKNLIDTTDEQLAEIFTDRASEQSDIQQARSICELACSSPAITWFDATLLVGAGISSPAELQSCPAAELMLRTEEFLLTRKGQECLDHATASEISRLLTWLAAAHLSEHESGIHSDVSDSAPSPSEPLSAPPQLNIIAQRYEMVHLDKDAMNLDRQATGKQPEVSNAISLTTRVEQCPLIDQRTAKRLMEVGYQDLGSLMNVDPNLIADELGSPRINPKDIALWQSQIRLASQIPNLTAKQAKLLSHCEFDSIESVAAIQPNAIQKKLADYLRSGRGKRKFRGMKPPSAATVIEWTETCKSRTHRNAA